MKAKVLFFTVLLSLILSQAYARTMVCQGEIPTPKQEKLIIQIEFKLSFFGNVSELAYKYHLVNLDGSLTKPFQADTVCDNKTSSKISRCVPKVADQNIEFIDIMISGAAPKLVNTNLSMLMPCFRKTS